jgi:hypothetical protein
MNRCKSVKSELSDLARGVIKSTDRRLLVDCSAAAGCLMKSPQNPPLEYLGCTGSRGCRDSSSGETRREIEVLTGVKEKSIPGWVLKSEMYLTGIYKPNEWVEIKDGDMEAKELFDRHYSRHFYKDGRLQKLFVGPGEKMVLVLPDYSALFVFRKFISMNEQTGINCAVFRNESKYLSSDLIMKAEEIAHKRWPGERLYTYVNKKKIKSINPGCCFKKAGWKKIGLTKGGLLIYEKFIQ